MTAADSRRGVFGAQVVSNEPICREHFRLTLSTPGFGHTRPGQFVQLGCQDPDLPADEPDGHGWAGPDDPGLRTRSLLAPVPLLRRPFSLAGAWPDPQRPGAMLLELIGRVVGLATARLGALKEGETIDLIGPLGNSFPMPAPGRTALLLGGGVGIPPMIYLSDALGAAGVEGVAICGVTSADLLPLTVTAAPSADGTPTDCIAEFSRGGLKAVVASDDGSIGVPGLITAALERVLARLGRSCEELVVYTCGPEPMMRAVTERALAGGIQTWVCMERSMACGMGTCQSCVCRVQPRGVDDWVYRLVCTDGPVFDGRELLWD